MRLTYLRHADTQEDGFISVLSQRFQSEITSQLLVVVDLDSEIHHQLDFEINDVVRQTILRDFRSAQTT